MSWWMDALSRLPVEAAEDMPMEVNNVDILHSPRHWDLKQLAAARQQDQPHLDSARWLAQQKSLNLAKTTGSIMHQVH